MYTSYMLASLGKNYAWNMGYGTVKCSNEIDRGGI